MNKSRIVLICACICGLRWVTEGYFEDRYRCVLDDAAIQVSLTTGDQLCLTYLSGIQQVLLATEIDRDAAATNAAATKWYDHIYRKEIYATLTEKKEALAEVQQKIGFAMRDFEQELFVRVKGIVWYYLLSYTATLEQKVDQGAELMQRLVLGGNTEQYAFVRHQMNDRERELLFLERIKESSTFATLVPALKWWIQLQEEITK